MPKINGTVGLLLKAVTVFVIVAGALIGFGKVLGNVTHIGEKHKEFEKEAKLEHKEFTKDIVELKGKAIALETRQEQIYDTGEENKELLKSIDERLRR